VEESKTSVLALFADTCMSVGLGPTVTPGALTRRSNVASTTSKPAVAPPTADTFCETKARNFTPDPELLF
jgi:hypothetical protein